MVIIFFLLYSSIDNRVNYKIAESTDVSENKAICYFNVLVDGRNHPELFLESIRKQIIYRYQITNVENADLSTLLGNYYQKVGWFFVALSLYPTYKITTKLLSF